MAKVDFTNLIKSDYKIEKEKILSNKLHLKPKLTEEEKLGGAWITRRCLIFCETVTIHIPSLFLKFKIQNRQKKKISLKTLAALSTIIKPLSLQTSSLFFSKIELSYSTNNSSLHTLAAEFSLFNPNQTWPFGCCILNANFFDTNFYTN